MSYNWLSKQNRVLLKNMKRKARVRSKYRARYNRTHPLGQGPLTHYMRPVKAGLIAFLVDLLMHNDY